MIDTDSSLFSRNNQAALRIFTVFLISFFLAMTFLTAFIVVPRINKSLEAQHISDSKITLQIETELFERFILNHKTLLEDLATFPVITSATLLSKSDNPDFIDLVDNFTIKGQKSRLVLQNIAGEIVYQTAEDIKGDFSPRAPWIDLLLNDEKTYNIQLLEQENDNFRFVISVPIQYLGQTEGLLSGEITAKLDDIFSMKTMDQGGAFKLKQNDTVIQTKTSHIVLPREAAAEIIMNNIQLTYISDDAVMLEAQNELRNTILGTLFIGLGISFTLFTILGYRTLMQSSNEEESTNYKLMSKAYSVPLLIGLIGIAASVSIFLLIQNSQKHQAQSKLLSGNKNHILAIENRITSNFEVLSALRSFFDASTHVSREEFKTFTAPLLKNNEDIQALEWIPQILGNERAIFENNATKDGHQNFQIIERDTNGKSITAPKRDMHFPVYYVEPFEQNKAVLGLDSPNNVNRATAIKKAKESGEITAAGFFKLIQDTKNQRAFLAFKPVYHGTPDYGSVIERNKNFKGLAVIVLRIGDIVHNALQDNKNHTAHQSIQIQDITNPNKPDTIFDNFEDRAIHPDFVSHRVMNVAGRKWRISAAAQLTTPAQGVWRPYVILIMGLLLTAFITHTFIQLIRRRQIIERVVDKRTKEIKDSKKFQDLVKSNIPDFLFVKDENFKIVDANAAFLNLYTEDVRNSVIGSTTFEEYKQEDIDVFFKHDRIALEKGYSETEETITFPDGQTRTLFTKKTRFTGINGKPFILGIARDITDMKQAEAEIMRSNIELERFAYVASHDLQEPLRMVTSFTELLENNYSEKLDSTAQEYISYAANGARRMQDLVNDLLEYARIGQDAENFKNVDMNTVISIVKDNLKDSIDATGAIISHTDLPIVYANPVRLMRVLQNLIGNSIKYQSEGTQPDITITSEQQDGLWYIAIHDNGIGMKPEYCEKIFEPFKRLHAKNEFIGTGMGLAICRRIIEGFGGRIWARSKSGEGSVFTFTVPVHTPVNLENQSPLP